MTKPLLINLILVFVALPIGYLIGNAFIGNDVIGNALLEISCRKTLKSGICGRVLSKDDTGLPDSPEEGILIIAIPSDKFDLLVVEGGYYKNTYSMRLVELSQKEFEKYGEAYALSGKNGEYALQVQSGSYVLCVANFGLPRRSTFPALIFGCEKVTVPEDRPLLQNITWEMYGPNFR
jgi:hypothetical protein